MDSAWEQKKLEASLSPAPRTERGARAVQGKVLENAADWASELQANIAQPKRVSAGQSPASSARRRSHTAGLCWAALLHGT